MCRREDGVHRTAERSLDNGAHVVLEGLEDCAPVRSRGLVAPLAPERLFRLREAAAEEHEQRVVVGPVRLRLGGSAAGAVAEQLDQTARQFGG
jgi:hypothetical protein